MDYRRAEAQHSRGHFGTQTARQSANQAPTIMIPLVITFAVLALIAAILGFGGIASQFAGIAKILLIVFIILAIVSFFF
jgi:uncharacterized membrane protein YtjA (UPF0391 family)